MLDEFAHKLPFRRLLIALTGAAADAGLLEYAAMVAGLCEATDVHFLYLTEPASTLAAARASALVTPEAIPAALRPAIETHFLSAPKPANLHHHALRGDPFVSVARVAKTHDVQLLLISPPGKDHTLAGHRRLLLRLIRESPFSLWVVPPRSNPAISYILSPIDFSATAAAAFELAVLVAYVSDASLLTLHVYFNSSVTTRRKDAETLREEKSDAVWEFKRRFDLTGVQVRLLVEESAKPDRAIARAAREQHADLIVMGTRRRTFWASLVLPGVTEHVAQRTDRPLLIVKSPLSRLGLGGALFDDQLRKKNDLRFG